MLVKRMIATSRWFWIAAVCLITYSPQSRGQITASSTTVVASGMGSAAGVGADALANVFATDGVNGLVVSSLGGNSAMSTVLSGLSSPAQIAFDTSRNLYVANGTTNQVLKYNSNNGILSPTPSATYGTGLGTVTGVAVDLSGNVYIVDAGNKQVVKVSGTTQTTLKAGLTSPKQVAVDRLGNVYIADSGANAVVYLPVGGGAASTVGTGLNAPQGVATDAADNVYIADTANSRIVMVPYSTTTSAPVTASQTTLTTAIVAPVSVALDSRGTLYVAAGGSIYRYTSSLNGIFFGLSPVQTATQVFPITITFTSAVAPASIQVVTTGFTGLDYQDAGGDTCTAGTSYVAGNSCIMNVTFNPLAVGPRMGAIVFYSTTNKVLAKAYLGGGGLGALINIDPGTVQEYANSGGTVENTEVIPNIANTTGSATTKSANGTFGAVDAVTDAMNNIIVADKSNNRILVLPPNPTQTTTVPTTAFSLTNGTTSISPWGVSIDGSGALIVTNEGGNCYLYPYENGTWSFADGQTIGSGYHDAELNAVDIAGNVFVVDYINGRVVEIPQNSTKGGYGTILSITGIVAGTSNPLGVAVDLYGNLAVSDVKYNFVYYLPVNGASSYSFSVSPLTGSVSDIEGVSFDASGSLWVSTTHSSATTRVPNENGVMNIADAELLSSAGGNALVWALWCNPATGNLYTFSENGASPGINVINRTVSSQPNTAIGTAALLANVGKTSGTTAVTYTNSGNLPVTFSGNGLSLLNDVADFPMVAPTGTPTCVFTSQLKAGYSCNTAFEFEPQSEGTRTISIVPTSNALLNPVLTITGNTCNTAVTPNTGTCTAATATVGISLALSSPATPPNPAPNQPLTITATLTPTAASGGTLPTATPTGYITFSLGGTAVSTLPYGASVAFNIPSGLAAGVYTVTAVYSGDANYAATSQPASTTFTVSLSAAVVTLTTTATQVNAGTSVPITATITDPSGVPAAGGTVTFTTTFTPAAGGSPTVTTAGPFTFTGGYYTYSPTFTALGTYVITSSYSGNNVYTSAMSGSVTVVVGVFTVTTCATTVTSMQTAPYVFGASFTTTTTVTPASGTITPTGTITYILNSGAPVLYQLPQQSYTFTPPPGTNVLHTYYSGNSNYTSCNSPATTIVVAKAPTSIAIVESATTLNAGATYTVTATVTAPIANPTGTVQFNIGSAPLGTGTLTPVKGSANTATASLTCSPANTCGQLPAGTDVITAQYLGDANDLTSVSTSVSVTVAVQPTQLSLSVFPALDNVYNVAGVTSYDAPPALTAIIVSTGTGNGIATSVPTGSIQFFIDGVSYGSVALANKSSTNAFGVQVFNDEAVYTLPVSNATTDVPVLAPGLHTYTASYSGDNDYGPAVASQPGTFYIASPTGPWPGSFTMTITPSPITISPGATGTLTLSLTPSGNYFGYVNLGCSGLPQYASCSINPEQLLLNGTNTIQSAPITILTQFGNLAETGRPKSNATAEMCGVGFVSALFLWFICPLHKSAKSRRWITLAALAVLSSLSALSGCGSHVPTSTVAGSYTLTVTANGSGGVTQTIPVSLTIQ